MYNQSEKGDHIPMKMKKLSFLWLLPLVCILLCGASSCEKFLENPERALLIETDKTPRYVVTIHEVIKYRRAGELEQDIDSFFGGTVCVNKNYFLHSRDIQKIEMVPRVGNPDFFDLKVTLSSRGQKIWSAMAVSRMENKKFCFVIDGMFYRNIIPRVITDPVQSDMLGEVLSVMVDGPFDPATAKGLQENSERNYKIFNP